MACDFAQVVDYILGRSPAPTHCHLIVELPPLQGRLPGKLQGSLQGNCSTELAADCPLVHPSSVLTIPEPLRSVLTPCFTEGRGS